MKLTLYLCDRIAGDPKLTVQGCEANRRRPKNNRPEGCSGCPGILQLNESLGRSGSEIDTSGIVPIEQVGGQGRFRRSYHRTDQERLGQKEGHKPMEMEYDPKEHITSDEIAQLAGLSRKARSQLKYLFAPWRIVPLGRGRIPGRPGRALFLYPRAKVLEWIELRKEGRSGGPNVRGATEAPARPSPPPCVHGVPQRSQAKEVGCRPPENLDYDRMVSQIRAFRDQAVRNAEEAKAKVDRAERALRDCQEKLQVASDMLEAAEKLAS